MHDTLCFTDENKIELEIKSDVNSEVTKLIPDIGQLQMLINHILDKKVAKTDMKLRHILSKGIEVSVLKLYLIYCKMNYVDFRISFN